jgi:hypothetical protein
MVGEGAGSYCTWAEAAAGAVGGCFGGAGAFVGGGEEHLVVGGVLALEVFGA